MWRFIWRKREFYGVIWQCFARVKCGNIMNGFGKCCDCRESHLLCDLLDRQISGMCSWARVTRILCVKHKNASWVFSSGDFVLESLFCAQRLWILNLFSADTAAVGLTVWLTKRLQFLDGSNVVYFIAKSCYFCEETLPSIASNNAVII